MFGKDSFTPPDTLYVGLWEVPITTQFTGSSVGEVMAGSYARVAVSNTFISWSTAGSGSKMIETQLDFPEAVENWGTVTHFAVLDAAVAGNMYVFGALASPKLVNAGDTFRFNQESIIIRID